MPALMISYAQNFEDVMLNRALKDVENGFYVDVGAWDPDRETVTRHFYEKGWRGINIEPVPTYRKALEASRSRDINLFVAAGAVEGQSKLTVLEGTGMSGLSHTLDETVGATDSASIIDVEVRTLGSILNQYAPENIHFLKIDCEGAEFDVITGLDLSAHRPWIILVEAITPITRLASHSQWEPKLLSSGYNFAYFDGLNRFYTAQERSELLEAFSVPPNILDDFRSVIFAPPVLPNGNDKGAERPFIMTLLHKLFARKHK